MKTIYISLAIAMLSFLHFNASAQDTKISAGLEVAIPTGDFGDAYTLGYGLSVGGELPVGDNIGVTLTAGYILLALDDALDGVIKSSAMIPLQLGGKYYFSNQQEGLYGHVQLGIHSNSVTTEDITILGNTIEGTTESESNLSYAIGAGYMLNESIDLNIRYNIISSSEDDIDPASYLGLRIGYNF